MEDGNIDTSAWLRRGEPVLTKARSKRKDVRLEESVRGGHQLRSYENPLEFYAFQPNQDCRISPEQHAAGVRYGQAFFDGCRRSRHAQWKYTMSAGGRLDPEALHFAGEEFRRASAAIRGRAEWWVTFKVCCLGETAGKGNFRRLLSGLDDLRKLYGM